jgi:peptide/nickel transport system substrate-binding protein
MRRRLLGVLSLAALLVGGCSSSTNTAAPSNGATSRPSTAAASAAPLAPVSVQLTGSSYSATPAAKTGGSLVLGAWEYPDTIDPYYAQHEYDIEVAGSMFDGLLKVTPDLRYAPDLATNVPTLDNGGVTLRGSGMDVTFVLKPDMQWSDGEPINCDDIKATWAWNMDPANSGLVGGTVGWEDISGVDGGISTTCVVHYSRIYEGYLNLVNPLLPAHYITTIAVKDARTKLYPMDNLSSGVYSGPYIPASAKAGSVITLKPNPNYQTVGGHAPWLKAVSWKYYSDNNAMIAGFKAGEFDLGQDLTESDLQSMTGIDPTTVVAHDSLTYELQAFNNTSIQTKFGADYATIINAVKLATDRQAIAAGPLAGTVSVIGNFVSPLSWFYKSEPDPAPADPTSARTLLANAGWSIGPDGYFAKAGKTLELSYCTTTRQVRLDTLTLVAAQLKSIGIKVDVNARPVTDVFGTWAGAKTDTPCNLARGNFDVAEFSYPSPVDPLVMYNAYVSTQNPDTTSAHDGQNITRVNLPALDQAYATIKSTVDFSRVRDAMYAIQDIYAYDQNTFELPLYFRKDVWLVGTRLHNFTGSPTTAGACWNIGDWWVG